MSYLTKEESDYRIARVKEIMKLNKLDVILVYYDEFNIGNGWYLTGWCPQFEIGAVLITTSGEPIILGGPESEPFAKLDSIIKETRNFNVFMVPDEEYPNANIIDFPQLLAELNSGKNRVKKVGLVGADRMPVRCYNQIKSGFKEVELMDITSKYLQLRYKKSMWEIEQIKAAFKMADYAYDQMRNKIVAGVSEIEVAASGEYAVRSRGASGFGFSTIVGSGNRSNAVVPTASSKILCNDELVMIGISPKINGYAGVVGDTIPVNGTYNTLQYDCISYLKDAFRLTKEQLFPGRIGKDIDAPARKYFEKHNLSKFLICPFAHTIGLHEAEAPFFGPNSEDELKPGMTVSVDISFFGHPKYNGVRIETGYEITENGPTPLSVKMDKILTED